MKRPPFEGLYPYVVFLFLGFCVADLISIPVRSYLLPTEPPPLRSAAPPMLNQADRGSYGSITSRNIFSVDGKIPESLFAKKNKDDEKNRKDAPPVPTTLPISLAGTIVHSNPEKSIANIEVKSKNTIIAVRVGKEIDKLATLVAVERGKAIIRNSASQRLEYVELKNLSKIGFTAAKPAAGPSEVKQVGQNKFEISRADLNKYTADMSNVLQQAAMAPRTKPSGELDCFEFKAIQPNSVYTKLGLQVGDCLRSVNGVVIDSPVRGLETYNQMKNSSTIKIIVDRDGRDIELDYNVR